MVQRLDDDGNILFQGLVPVLEDDKSEYTALRKRAIMHDGIPSHSVL